MKKLRLIKEKIISFEDHIAILRYQSRPEEIVNGIVHAIGTGLSIAALVILVIFASIHGDIWRITSFSIFGSTLIFLYFSSTLYHISKNEKIKKTFRILDYSGIFLLIAGTYTPIALVSMRGVLGLTFLGIIWLTAFIGIALRVIFSKRIELILSSMYVLMGWSIVFAAKPVMAMLPLGLMIWLLIGGLSYTAGLVFLSWKKLPFHHAVWHLFVVIGSASHFFGILFYLAK